MPARKKTSTKAAPSSKEPVFFATPAAFRAWFQKHHHTEPELLVGFHKKHTGTPSITWPESVDQALCFGWIDGVRRSLGEDSYCIRFTPRRAGSIWSSINVARIEALRQEGALHPAGEKAFAGREQHKTSIYAYEQRKEARLSAEHQAKLEKNKKAWTYFREQPAGYRQQATYWVVSAKQEATRERRLETLIDCCEAGERLPQYRWTKAR